MSEVKEHSVIYLSPSDDPEREWCQDDVWEESVRYNLGADFDRVTAERDAALVDVERLDNALNVTDAAATKWLSELTKARELFELILDYPRLVVAMSSDILVPIKSLLSGKPEPFESKVSTLQQRLTAADERYDRDVLGLNNEGDPIGGDPAGGYKNDNAELCKRVAVLKGLLRRVVDSSVLSFEQDAPEELEELEADICAALKPAGGGGDE